MKNWVDKALLIHSLIIKQSGGNDLNVDIGKLESAIMSVFSTFDGKSLYDTKEQKAARLCYNIISSHPFTDGNKRIGVHLFLLFLKTEGISVEYTDEELECLGFGIAEGRLDYNYILNWINQHKK